MKGLHTIASFCFLLYISRVANTTSRRYEPLQLRLTGEHEGRVKVSNGGPWGPLCDDQWTANDANVVCRTLGYTHALFPNVTGHDVEVSGSGDLEMVEVFSDTVRCVGNETNIAFCPMDVSFSDRCDENDGVNVTCEGIVKVRLVNGPNDRQGRVEVFHRGLWGTVCENNFGLPEANVVCRMLEFGFADPYFDGQIFGAGSGKILVDDLQCTGDELNIGQCFPKYTGTHNCTHERDVGISCEALPVRLVDGDSPNEGRVEVHFERSWGTICDDNWDINSGKVVCQMLGYPGVNKAYISSVYGNGIGQIVLDNVICSGGESHIARCDHAEYGNHNCNHDEDSGVDCLGEATSNIRLRDGPDPSHGRLELYLMGAWGTACRRNWTSIDSSVACRKLGYFGAADILSGPTSYGKGTGMVLVQEPRCQGKESDLLQCDIAYPLGVTNCTHDEDVWVNCLAKDNLEVRLVGEHSPNKGRVEVLHRGRWGTICDDNWNILDSHVVCRMRGFDAAEGYGHFGEGSGDILLDEVQCNGSEENLGHCMRQDYGVHDCDHSEDVGVSCITYVSESTTVSFSQSTNEKPRTGFTSVLFTGTAVVFFIFFLISAACLVYAWTRIQYYRKSAIQAQRDLHLQPLSQRKVECSNSYAKSFTGSCHERTETKPDLTRGDTSCRMTTEPKSAPSIGHTKPAETVVKATGKQVQMAHPEVHRTEPSLPEAPRPDSPVTYECPLDIWEPPEDYEDVMIATRKTNVQ